MQEAWRAYLDLALGFTEASRKRATKVARKLVGRGGATADQLQSMAEDLVSTSMANRESLIRLVRFELDRALGRVGLATAEEVSQLTKRVRELEEELRVAHGGAAPAVPAAFDDELAAATASAAAPAKVVRKAVAKKAVVGAPATTAAPAKAAPAKAAPAKAAPVKATAAVKAEPATVTVAKAEPAKTTPATVVAKTAVAKKAVAKAPGKVAAKKTTPSKATAAGTAGTQP
jgi:polyhydroxyalkanoate synthesis regulator phasin